MKMRRKILGMLLCVVLTALVGCGAKDSDKSGGAAKEESAKTEAAEGSEEGDDKVIRVGCEATTPGALKGTTLTYGRKSESAPAMRSTIR